MKQFKEERQRWQKYVESQRKKLEELQRSYHGHENSSFPNVYEYTGYSSAIDADGGGGGGDSGGDFDFSLDEGKKNWKKLVNEQRLQTLLTEAKIHKEIDYVNEKLKDAQSLSPEEIKDLIQTLVGLDKQLQQIEQLNKQKTGDFVPVTFTNVSGGQWGHIITNLNSVINKVDDNLKKQFNYLIARNGKGIIHQTKHLDVQRKKKDSGVLKAVGEEMGKALTPDLAEYVSRGITKDVLLRYLASGIKDGMDKGTDLEQPIMTSKHLPYPIISGSYKDQDKYNFFNIGEYLGAKISPKFSSDFYSTGKTPEGHDVSQTVLHKVQDLLGIVDKRSDPQNLDIHDPKMVADSLSRGIMKGTRMHMKQQNTTPEKEG